ncbi:MAG: homoserine O-acetyltransferase MetX [Moorellales bacterium]
MGTQEDVGLTQTQYLEVVTPPEDFVLECGARLSPVTVAYETYGQPNATGDNVILILHALTGDAHAAGKHHPEERVPGWWDGLIGPGRAFDTTRYWVICSNILGSCYGTTGPASINPATGRPYGMSFPVVTVRDMVRLQRLFLERLGVRRLFCVAGGSLGGMQALEWLVTFPDYVEAAIPIACPAQVSAQGIAFNLVQRLAIMQDPAWQNGDYYPGPGPQQGLALARMVGIITYKSDESWRLKFGRAFAGTGPQDLFRFDSRFEVENYLHYQGRKLVQRFDANCYLYLTKAMDLHDLGRGHGSWQEALRRVQAKVMLMGISSDILYPPYQQKEIVRALRRLGKEARYVELKSPFGHDAFLIEFDKMTPIIRGFLAEVERQRGPGDVLS